MPRGARSLSARSATVTTSSYKCSTDHTRSRGCCRRTPGRNKDVASRSLTSLLGNGACRRIHPARWSGSDCDPCASCAARDRRHNVCVRGVRWWPLRATSSVVLLVALLATGAAGWAIHAVVHDQEERLLKERSNELNLLLTNSLQSIQSTLSAQGGILKATNGSASAFEQAAAPIVTADPAEPTLAWLRPTTGGYVVAAAAGGGLRRGEGLTAERAQAFDAAMQSPNLRATPIFDSDRKLGFVLGPPSAPAGTVLYRQAVLGPVKAPRAAASAPYAELDVVIYGAPAPVPTAV